MSPRTVQRTTTRSDRRILKSREMTTANHPNRWPVTITLPPRFREHLPLLGSVCVHTAQCFPFAHPGAVLQLFPTWNFSTLESHVALPLWQSYWKSCRPELAAAEVWCSLVRRAWQWKSWLRGWAWWIVCSRRACLAVLGVWRWSVLLVAHNGEVLWEGFSSTGDACSVSRRFCGRCSVGWAAVAAPSWPFPGVCNRFVCFADAGGGMQPDCEPADKNPLQRSSGEPPSLLHTEVCGHLLIGLCFLESDLMISVTLFWAALASLLATSRAESSSQSCAWVSASSRCGKYSNDEWECCGLW